jgi:hypothetical protein
VNKRNRRKRNHKQWPPPQAPLSIPPPRTSISRKRKINTKRPAFPSRTPNALPIAATLKADLAKLQALQKERLDKPTENAKSQERMYSAIRMMLKSQKLNVTFDPAQFGFEFSLAEINHCYQVLANAESLKLPLPSVVKLLAAFRNGTKEAQAA